MPFQRVEGYGSERRQHKLIRWSRTDDAGPEISLSGVREQWGE